MKKELQLFSFWLISLFLIFRFIIFGGHWSEDVSLTFHDSYLVFTPLFLTLWLGGLALLFFYQIRSGRLKFEHQPANILLLILSLILTIFHGLAWFYLQDSSFHALSSLLLIILLINLGTLIFISRKTNQI
jgi:hypothetical protein